MLTDKFTIGMPPYCQKKGAATVLILLFAFLFPVACFADDASIPVYILFGQSNMCGMGKATDIPKGQRAVPKNIEYYRGPRHVTNYTQLQNFGPEVQFMSDLAAAYPDQQFIVYKSCAGGTSLLAWSPTWTCEEADLTGDCKAGPLYANSLATLARVINYRSVTYSALVMMQGESDSQKQFTADAYAANLKKLIEAFRSDLGAPELPLILGVVNAPAPPFVPTVAQAQINAAHDIPFVYPVITDRLTRVPKNKIHYDGAGQIVLGHRMAAQAMKLLGGGNQTGQD